MGDYLASWIIPIDKYFDDPVCRSGIENPLPNYPESLASATTGMPSTTTRRYGWIYYRRDLLMTQMETASRQSTATLPLPPRTWQELLDVAEFFNGKDWDGDGSNEYGITMHLKVGEQGFFNYLALAASFVVNPAPGNDPTKVTRYNNVFWFDPETMEPLINSPGHVRALELMKEWFGAGPHAMLGLGLAEAWDSSCRGDAACAHLRRRRNPLQDPRQSSIRGLQGVVAIGQQRSL